MTNHKVTKKTIIGFMVGFCILLMIVCIPFYSYTSKGYQFIEVSQKNKMINKEDENSLDVLFLGDSECWAAFSPIQLFGEYGIASYNCATPGQWTGDTVAVLKNTLKKQTPSVMVLETSTLYSYPNHQKYLLSQKVPVFHYHYVLKDFKQKFGGRKAKGANIVTTAVPYTGSTDYMSLNTASSPIDSLSQEYLDEVLQICKDNNITLLMVTSPSALNWTEGKHQAVDAWCMQNQITYIDYNEKDEMQKISIDWSTDTRDGGDHLNLSGSKKITTDIGKYLSKNFSLTDHRNEEEYAEWAKIYAGSKLYNEGKK
jgi:hypothetical protein